MKKRTSKEKGDSMPDNHGKQAGITTPKEVIDEVNKRKVKAWREQLPPKEIFEEFAQQGKFTETQVKILNAVYSNSRDSMTKIAKQIGVAKNSVKHAVDKLVGLYQDYTVQALESHDLKSSSTDVIIEKQQKLTPKEEKLSAKTTTFREVDKTTAQTLKIDFHNTAVRREVYARLGELLIYTLLQAGIANKDKIVEYSQRMVDDSEALYSYIKDQLDVLIKSAGPHAIATLQRENYELKAKLRALEKKYILLEDRLRECMETGEYIIKTLLNRDQLIRLASWIATRDTMKNHQATINRLLSENASHEP